MRFGLLFFLTTILVCVVFTAPQASAQNEQLSPAEKSWCSLGYRGIPSTCSFPSAQEACEVSVENFYPNRPGALVDVKISSNAASASCTVTRTSAQGLFIGTPTVRRGCVDGTSLSGGQCTPRAEPISNSCSVGGAGVTSGNPIDLFSGIKVQKVTDFVTADNRLKFSRTYASRSYGILNNQTTGLLGRAWSIDMLPRIDFVGSSTPRLFLPGHQAVRINCAGANCIVLNDAVSGGGDVPRVQFDFADAAFSGQLKDVQNTIPFIDEGGVRYIFKSQQVGDRIYFALRRTEYPGGYFVDYTSRLVAEQGFPAPVRFITESMTDSYGRTMLLDYNREQWVDANGDNREIIDGNTRINHPVTTGTLSRVVLPDLSTLNFSYDSATSFGQKWRISERLKGVQRVSASGEVISNERYHYEDASLPFALTGITDTANVRYATWDYDEFGLATSSEHANGVDRFEFNYENSERVTETNPLGRKTIYERHSSGDYFDEINGQASLNCVGDASAISNTASTLQVTDKEGNITRSGKDSRGWVTSKTEALGTFDEVVTSTEWHPVFKLITRRITPGLTDERTYDDDARLVTRTLTDTSPLGSAPRTWTYTYDGPNVASVDGPSPGPSDTQLYTWTGPKLTSITNEVGHFTRITQHNIIGAPEVIEDPNGNVTRLEYDSEHKLTAIIGSDGDLNARTRLTYNLVDLLTSVTQPNGSALRFEYDDARRLIAITNSVGERISYTRNAMGGILSSRISDSGGSIEFDISQVTDEINRVIKTATVGGSTGLTSETSLGYDREDNLTSITDPRQGNWQQGYDGLNRLVKEIDPLGAETDYGLANNSDARNPLNSVKDARNITTNFVRNGYGEVIREVSLEAGITEYIRDARGLVTQMTDARGIVTNYTYDAAGRLLTETYPSESLSDITYTYDEGENGIGELTTVTEGFGATSYAYDSLGHMTLMTRSINGQSYSKAYTYDLAGEVLTETYPSGRTVRMVRDAAARITGIEAKGPGETEFAPLLSNITYAAFGPMTGAEFADGHNLDIEYDTAYRAKSLRRTTDTSSLMDLSFRHDASGNIIAMEDNVRPERNQYFVYDPLSRLILAENNVAPPRPRDTPDGFVNDDGYGSIEYDYNLGGDRTEMRRTPNGGSLETTLYNYDTATARLTDLTQAGSTLRLFGYDDSGSIISDTRSDDVITTEFAYGMNARGRLSTVSQDGALAASYTYDMSEQRIIKAVSGATAIHYHYDGEGRLIAETDAATGETIRDYVWLGLTPIASFGAANDNGGGEDCADEIAALEADIADRTSRIDNNAARIIQLGDLVIDKQGRIANNAARITELGDLVIDKQSRIDNNAARITELDALITDKQSRIDANAARITELEALIVDKQARIAALNPATRADRIAELEALIIEHQGRIVFLTTRNAELAALITGHETRITELTTRNAELATLIMAHETRMIELTDRNAELSSLTSGHEERIVFLTERNAVLSQQRDAFQAELDALLATGCDNPPVSSGVTFLHSDHLGRPKFATDSDGNVTWDGGITTPFGVQVTALAAQTQALMFPGQYEDAETTGAGVTLSHNWHRTYDPTLGRYLQSDPIGLAGGLNRYAYVGGNPVGWVDPRGEFGLLGAAFGAGVEFGIQYLKYGDRWECYDWGDIIVSAAVGAFAPGLGTTVTRVRSWNKAAKLAKTAKRRLRAVAEAESAVFEYVGYQAAKQVGKLVIDTGCDC